MKDPHLENADVVSAKKSDLARWAWLIGLVAFFALAFFMALDAEAPSAPVNAVPATVGKGQSNRNSPPDAKSGQPDPCSLEDVVCPGENEEKPTLSMLAEPGESPDYSLPDYDDPGPYLVTTTGFSSHECKTTWCRANAGKPAGKQVALNPRFGKRGTNCKVIVYGLPNPDITTYAGGGVTFDVIGYTDQQTSLDIWFGDDYAGALAFGRQELKVDLVACPS